MNYASFLIRQKRLQKDWSQEGLCRGICTTSYLSKIEKGKAEPSDEILNLLFRRLGIAWHIEPNMADFVERAYDLLFSWEIDALKAKRKETVWQDCAESAHGLDIQLLECTVAYIDGLEKGRISGMALDEMLEEFMDARQLALQRVLQGRAEEAVLLYSRAFFYERASSVCYYRGDTAQAIEYAERANELAAKEGRPLVMLFARLIIGNSYSNLHDFASMEHHYKAAQRLARAMNEQDRLVQIDYNIASTCIEMGEYQRAYDYFSNLKMYSRLSLHKLAICCELLGKKEEALIALNHAGELEDESPCQVEAKMCRVVRLRLIQEDYLDREEYGEALLEVFSLCRKYLPAGFCLFHLPWMLEWYEHRRQYKQAYSLLLDFPDYRGNEALKR